jgi:hypothetical protein
LVDGLFYLAAGAIASRTGRLFGIERSLGVAMVWQLLPAALNWLLIAQRGQSIGKLVARTRIMLADGSNPGFVHGVVLRDWPMRAFGLLTAFGWSLGLGDNVRLLGGLLPAIDAVLIFGRQCRCAHDFFAATYVVNAGSRPRR